MKAESQAAEILRADILRRKLASPEQLDGEFTKEQLDTAHSKVYEYFLLTRQDDVEDALERPARQAANRANLAAAKAKRIWNKGNQADALEIAERAAKWAEAYPQFDQNVSENCSLLVQEIKSSGQLVTDKTLTDAFVKLAQKGLLYLTPAAIDLDGEESIRGWELTTRSDFYKFLQPYKTLTPEEKEAARIQSLSADKFKEEFLSNDTIPAFVQKSIQKAVSLFKAQHPEYVSGYDAQQVLLEYIYAQKLPVCFNSLELAFTACKKQLRDIGAIDDSSRPLKYGVSTLIENPIKATVPVPQNRIEREVIIAEPQTPKKFTRRQIDGMNSQELAAALKEYPQLAEAIEEMYRS